MHKESRMLRIDLLAQHSRLSDVNPNLKLLVAVCSLLLCVATDSWVFLSTTAIIMMIVVVKISSMKFVSYLELLTIPSLFILLSGLAILVQISNLSIGVISIPIGSWYLCITKLSINKTITVILRAYAAFTCLFMISLTTPMSDIIHALRCFKVPEIIIELMYLIYRFIMILLDVHNRMTIAADSRLGYSSFKNTYRSMKGISLNLLFTSFQNAQKSFIAMEARGYRGKLIFWREDKPIHKKELIIAIVYGLIISLFFLMERI